MAWTRSKAQCPGDRHPPIARLCMPICCIGRWPGCPRPLFGAAIRWLFAHHRPQVGIHNWGATQMFRTPQANDPCRWRTCAWPVANHRLPYRTAQIKPDQVATVRAPATSWPRLHARIVRELFAYTLPGNPPARTGAGVVSDRWPRPGHPNANRRLDTGRPKRWPCPPGCQGIGHPKP